MYALRALHRRALLTCRTVDSPAYTNNFGHSSRCPLLARGRASAVGKARRHCTQQSRFRQARVETHSLGQAPDAHNHHDSHVYDHEEPCSSSQTGVIHREHTHHQHSQEQEDNDHNHSHAHSHDHPPGHSHSHGHNHSHEPQSNDSNPFHRLLNTVLRATRLLQAADRLRENPTAAVAMVVCLAIALLSNWAAASQWAAQEAAQRVGLAATAAMWALAGIPSAVDMAYSVTAGNIDTHVLMTLAAFGTLVIGSALEGALLLVLFQASHTVEHILTARAAGDLTALFEGIPAEATLVDLGPDGAPAMASQRQAHALTVAVGATILVKPGERVPLDGAIVYGAALVSTEHITGESLPVRRGAGEEVPAGALNHDGVLVVRASRPAADSTPARIAKLTASAQARKPQLRRWIDTFGEWYSKAVIGATLVALVVLPAAGVPLVAGAGQRGAVYRAMGLLTTASPCALVLVPLAYVSAIAAVTSRGMLIKGGRVLDALARCTTVAFDKTGTLTTGTLTCTGMATVLLQDPQQNGHTPAANASFTGEGWQLRMAAGGGGAEALHALGTAVALSQRANHPVSKATAAAGEAVKESLPAVEVHDFQLVPGAGVQGSISYSEAQRHVRFGSVEYAAQVLPAEAAQALSAAAARIGKDNAVSVFVETSSSGREDAEGAAHVWLFTFEDTVHTRSIGAVAQLVQGSWRSGWARQRDALQVVMLTGDNAASAGRVAALLGISQVHAGLTPQQKLQEVQALRGGSGRGGGGGGGGGVIMVGDGINDAPALAAADVGMALARSPTDAAASAAEIVALDGDGISALPFLLALSRRTQHIILQNMALAVGSILVLALPMLCGVLPLWLAVSLHEGSTLLVALNSLRLLYGWDRNPPPPAAAPLSAAEKHSAELVEPPARALHEGASSEEQLGAVVGSVAAQAA